MFLLYFYNDKNIVFLMALNLPVDTKNWNFKVFLRHLYICSRVLISLSISELHHRHTSLLLLAIFHIHLLLMNFNLISVFIVFFCFSGLNFVVTVLLRWKLCSFLFPSSSFLIKIQKVLLPRSWILHFLFPAEASVVVGSLKSEVVPLKATICKQPLVSTGWCNRCGVDSLD